MSGVLLQGCPSSFIQAGFASHTQSCQYSCGGYLGCSDNPMPTFCGFEYSHPAFTCIREVELCSQACSAVWMLTYFVIPVAAVGPSPCPWKERVPDHRLTIAIDTSRG